MSFGRKSLGDILKTFDKTLDDLNELSSRNQDQIVQHNSTIATLRGTVASLEDEAERALIVHRNVSNLLGK